jgi:hypothetical protein
MSGEMTMKLTAMLALALGLAGLGLADDTVKQDVKDAGHASKKAVKKVGHNVKKTSKKVVNKSAEKVGQGADKVQDKTK